MKPLVDIFRPDTIDYSDYGYDKPIKYSDDFLQKIANNTKNVALNEEHTDKIIGSLSDFVFEKGHLSCNVDTDVDILGKGISPKFGFDLIEYDDYYLAVDGKLIDAGLTDTPRSHIVCNSVKNGDNLNEDLLKREMDRNAELERKLVKQDNEIIKLKEKLNTLSELEDTISKLQDENNKYASNYEDLIKKAKAYDDGVAKQKEALIQKIADGDENLAKNLQNHTLQQLEDVFDIYAKYSKPKGTGTGEEDDEPQNQQDDGDDDVLSYEQMSDLHEKVFGKGLKFDF